MTTYEIDISYLTREFETIVLDADNEEDAEYKAKEFIYEESGGTQIEVEEIKEVVR